MKSIKEIYESLKEQDETVLFQVKNRKTLNIMLNEFKKEFSGLFEYKDWTKYLYVPVREIFLFVGKWRLGAAGIFPRNMRINREYTLDYYCRDWKSSAIEQMKQTGQVHRFIEIMDKHRKDIRISRTKFEDMED